MVNQIFLKYRLSPWALLMLTTAFTSCFADGYPFARAFTTEEQREYLDRNRQLLLDKYKRGAGDLPESEIRFKDKTERFVLSGMVIREDGKNMVWVNGKSKLSKNPHQQVENTHLIKRELRNEKVRLIYEEKYRTLKPGQVWLVDEGLVKELHDVEKEYQKRKESSSSSNKTNAVNQSTISGSIKQIQELQKLTQ